MKRFLLIVLAVAFITVFIPLTVVLIMSGTIDNSQSFDAPETAKQLKIIHPDTGIISETDMHSYLTCVVAAEMPATFEPEALKAQAVAARTYLVSRMHDGTHGNADICTDSTHCQAWVSEEDFKASHSDELFKKISDAVKETEKEIITYKGKPISAVFFSTSSGITENAEDVWGNEVPYLKSVISKGDELALHYKSETSISIEEFKKIAAEEIDDLNPSADLISDISRTKSGGIKTLKLYGKEITGTRLRSLYNLRSTNADITVSDDSVTFSVTGYGHNVGMSQYGANYMAANKKDYRDILKHYYSGVKIEKR